MTERPPGDRRVATALDVTRPSRVRRLTAALRDGLYRPLAEDDDRAAYWVRHVRMGVLITEVAAWSVVGYTFVTETPGRHHPVLLALSGLVILTVPGLLLLPLDAMMRDSRGPTLFYAWSVLTTAIVVIGTRLDGGSSSPLDGLLFLTLTFMAVAYPPYGVVAMGSVMTGSYFVLRGAARHLHLGQLLPHGPGVDHDHLRDVLGQLVGGLRPPGHAHPHPGDARGDGPADRHPQPPRLPRAGHLPRSRDAAWGHQTVVCLVDLDGFKAVNDAGGHAAGDAMLKAVGAWPSGARSARPTPSPGWAATSSPSSPTRRSNSSGEMLAERLRAAVAQVGGHRGVTASVGVAEVEPGDDVGDLMHRADAAMYRSKTAGGDRVTTLAY